MNIGYRCYSSVKIPKSPIRLAILSFRASVQGKGGQVQLQVPAGKAPESEAVGGVCTLTGPVVVIMVVVAVVVEIHFGHETIQVGWMDSFSFIYFSIVMPFVYS